MADDGKDEIYYLRHDAEHIAEGTPGTPDALKRFGQAVADLLDDLLVHGVFGPKLVRALQGYDVMPGLRDQLLHGQPFRSLGNTASVLEEQSK